MINLLPPETKESYHYARRNSRLIKWVVAFCFAIVGLAAIGAGGIFYINQASKPYDAQIAATQASLQQQDQAGVQKQIQDISNSLKLVVQVLSKEVVFSELLKQMGVITPSNATLSDLSISKVEGALDITANTADYTAATQFQVNMADAENKIFSKADIISINCTAGGEEAGASAIKAKYPCTAIYRALFATDSPFLFISTGKTPPKAAQP